MKNRNDVTLIGTIKDVQPIEFVFDGESCKAFTVEIKRKSGNCDLIPVFATPKYEERIEVGKHVFVAGDYISYNKRGNERTHLILMVRAKYVREEEIRSDENKIVMDGYLCKSPVLRKTPSGIEICDILIANNNGNGGTYYIPCVTWWSRARETSMFCTGDRVKYIGRIQSRIYEKKLKNGEIEYRTVYEVSIRGIEKYEKS